MASYGISVFSHIYILEFAMPFHMLCDLNKTFVPNEHGGLSGFLSFDILSSNREALILIGFLSEEYFLHMNL